MDVVVVRTGPEAIVRTLLRQWNILNKVCLTSENCGEIGSFSCVGSLQDLELRTIFAPLMSRISGFQEIADTHTPKLTSSVHAELLETKLEIWQAAPWELLEEHLKSCRLS